MVNSGGTDGRTGGTYLRYAEREPKKKQEREKGKRGRWENNKKPTVPSECDYYD